MVRLVLLEVAPNVSAQMDAASVQTFLKLVAIHHMGQSCNFESDQTHPR